MVSTRAMLLASVLASAVMINPPPAARADGFFETCPSGHVGVATTVTSCAFAENVRGAYLRGEGPVVTVYSPVTGAVYDMTCEPGFVAQLDSGDSVPSVRCTGGYDAVVIIF